MAKHTREELKQWQALPLSAKIEMTAARINEWVNKFGEDGCYVSFSGGKDSTVLLDIVRNVCGYKNIPAVFVDIPTQHPELRQFVETFDNVEIIKPKIGFIKVVEKYGFPLFSKDISETIYYGKKYFEAVTSDDNNAKIKGYWGIANLLGIDRSVKENKEILQMLRGGEIPQNSLSGCSVKEQLLHGIFHNESDKKIVFDKTKYRFMLESPFYVGKQCCSILKKTPAHSYYRKTGRTPITAQMASESGLREQKWKEHGCNGFDTTIPTSNPMAFWLENDILEYIYYNHIPICSVYGDIVIDSEADSVEERISNGLSEHKFKTTGWKRTGCVLCGFGCHLEKESRFVRLKETNPKMYKLLDVVKNNGVTYREAIDWVNEHGGFNIKY